jgi:GH24 family phage-related lysozyme (muramidase)
MPHTPSEKIISKIKEFEGCMLKAYRCPAGVLTIGYGITDANYNITGTKITENLTITQEKADEWLRKSLITNYAPRVEKYDNIYHWNQNQFDALLSFAYNIGSIDQLTNNGKKDIQTISNDILLYKYANKKVLSGLEKRRAFEKNLFDTPVEGSQNNINQNNNNQNNTQDLYKIANEVIMGKWDVGEERKRKLQNAGYNYNEVQKIVNQLMK